VDPRYGNNATAERENLARPYADIGTAILQALSGDVVYLQPGLYEESVNLRDGVNLFLTENATIAGPTGAAVLIAGATGITTSILGDGSFRATDAELLNILSPDFNIRLEGEVFVATTPTTPALFRLQPGSSGVLNITAAQCFGPVLRFEAGSNADVTIEALRVETTTGRVLEVAAGAQGMLTYDVERTDCFGPTGARGFLVESDTFNANISGVRLDATSVDDYVLTVTNGVTGATGPTVNFAIETIIAGGGVLSTNFSPPIPEVQLQPIVILEANKIQVLPTTTVRPFALTSGIVNISYNLMLCELDPALVTGFLRTTNGAVTLLDGQETACLSAPSSPDLDQPNLLLLDVQGALLSYNSQFTFCEGRLILAQTGGQLSIRAGAIQGGPSSYIEQGFPVIGVHSNAGVQMLCSSLNMYAPIASASGPTGSYYIVDVEDDRPASDGAGANFGLLCNECNIGFFAGPTGPDLNGLIHAGVNGQIRILSQIMNPNNAVHVAVVDAGNDGTDRNPGNLILNIDDFNAFRMSAQGFALAGQATLSARKFSLGEMPDGLQVTGGNRGEHLELYIGQYSFSSDGGIVPPRYAIEASLGARVSGLVSTMSVNQQAHGILINGQNSSCMLDMNELSIGTTNHSGLIVNGGGNFIGKINRIVVTSDSDSMGGQGAAVDVGDDGVIGSGSSVYLISNQIQSFGSPGGASALIVRNFGTLNANIQELSAQTQALEARSNLGGNGTTVQIASLDVRGATGSPGIHIESSAGARYNLDLGTYNVQTEVRAAVLIAGINPQVQLDAQLMQASDLSVGLVGVHSSSGAVTMRVNRAEIFPNTPAALHRILDARGTSIVTASFQGVRVSSSIVPVILDAVFLAAENCTLNLDADDVQARGTVLRWTSTNPCTFRCIQAVADLGPTGSPDQPLIEADSPQGSNPLSIIGGNLVLRGGGATGGSNVLRCGGTGPVAVDCGDLFSSDLDGAVVLGPTGAASSVTVNCTNATGLASIVRVHGSGSTWFSGSKSTTSSLTEAAVHIDRGATGVETTIRGYFSTNAANCVSCVSSDDRLRVVGTTLISTGNSIVGNNTALSMQPSSANQLVAGSFNPALPGAPPGAWPDFPLYVDSGMIF